MLACVLVGCVGESKEIGATVTQTEGSSGSCEAASDCATCLAIDGCHFSDGECQGACVADAACYGPDGAAKCPEPECPQATDCDSCLAMEGCNWTDDQCNGVCLEAAMCFGPDSPISDMCPGTAEGTQGETTQAETTAGSSGSESGTTGDPQTCEEAQTEAQCDAFPDFDEGAFFTCGWVPTVVYAGGESCQVVPDTGFEGACVLTEQEDTCGTLETSTCPDDTTLVYFNSLGLEIGAIELVVLEAGVCSEATLGFEPCVMIDDGDTVTFEPPECGCGCPR